MCGCGGDESNLADPIDPWEPVSIVGQWQLIRIEYYASDGTLKEQLRLNADEQDVVVFNEAGFYRYFDCPDGEEYEGIYTYDRLTRRLEMGTSVRRTSVVASYACNTAADDYSNGLMRWVYEADETGVWKETFYVPCKQPLPAPPEKEGDMTVYFPDENLRNYMIAHFDTDGDGRISISEAARIEKIELWNITTGDIKVTSLEGIEYCTALTYLYCCCSQLPTLDVSRNTVLEILNCSQNQLTTLNVSQNTALETLLCFENQLSTLDVSNCKQLQKLYLNPMPSLKTLYIATGQEIPNKSIPNTTQILDKYK